MMVQVLCPVFPTEDDKKVEMALNNLFYPCSIEKFQLERKKEFTVRFSNSDRLSVVRQYIHDLRIIDAVRKKIEANANGFDTFFNLDKQAALLSKIRLIDDTDGEPPLGSIKIMISFVDEKEFEMFNSWFIPLTKDGKIVQD